MNWTRAGLIFVIAALLRYPHLERRPMHADEAIQAARLDDRRYDPLDYHGPVLQLVTPARYATATEAGLRAVPATAGALLAALPGPAPLYAGLLLALSPAMTWYSRDYIPEMLLVFWTGLLMLCGRRYGRSPSVWRAVPVGLAAGLMLATKETAVIALAAAGVVWVRRVRAAHAAAGAAAMVAVLAATLAPAGSMALLGSYTSVWIPRAVAPRGHEHGPFYYLGLLLRTEWPILLLAAAGAWKQRRLAVYAVLVALLYSAVPYKTPWCALTVLHAMALLAGFGAVWLVERLPRLGPAVLAAGCILLLGTDPAPAWSYVETSPDVFHVREKLDELAPETRVQVFSSLNVWPLPWYLRRFPDTRYERTAPQTALSAPVILATPEMEAALVRALYELPPPGQRYLFVPLFERPVWLRPDVELRGFRRQNEGQER